MNKEQIFGMYLHNEVEYSLPLSPQSEGKKVDKFDQILADGSGETETQIMTYCGDVVPISCCSLILSPVSEMNIETLTRFFSETGTLSEVSKIRAISFFRKKVQYEFDFLGGGGSTVWEFDFNKLTVEQFFWLIQHGYALDDSWFSSGICVREAIK